MFLFPPLKPKLSAAFRDVASDNARARAAAADSLGGAPESRADEAREALRPLADDADGGVRAAAIASLGRLEDVEALDVILARFDDLDPTVRQIAIMAAAEIGDPRALPALERALRRDDLQAAIAWRGARAEALAQRGEHAEAVALAQAGVEIAAATDALLDHADARMAAAAALRAAGRSDEAEAEEQRARELWRDKGATLLLERAGAAPGVAEEPAAAPARASRRLRPNAASALAARFETTFMARDDAGLAALWSDDLVVVDHPTGRRYGLDGHLDSLRRFRAAENPSLRVDPIATLGDSLVLARRPLTAGGTTGSRADVAAWERVEHVVFQSGEDGRIHRVEIFAADRLGEALLCLYRRFGESLPEGAERQAALSVSRGNFFGRIDLDTLAANIAPDIDFVDHRRLGFEPTHGRAAFIALVRSLREASSDSDQHADRILAAEPHALLLRMTNTGTDQATGGRFERHFVRAFVAGAEGIERIEQFEIEDEREAFVRFGELTAGTAESPEVDHFANAAARANAAWVRGFANHDWAAIEGSIAPSFVFDDRRSLRHLTLDRSDFLAQFRDLFDRPESRMESERVATRGERLSLHRHRFTGRSDSGGDVDFGWHLALCEVDEAGRFVACIPFDLEDEVAAWAELDARAESGEDSAHPKALRWSNEFARAFAARDWDALAAISAPEQVAVNHRSVGWGTLRGASAWVETLRALVDLAPDTRMRLDHRRLRSHSVFWRMSWVGTRQGGAYEAPILVVTELDDAGLQTRIDVWDVEQLAEAWRRFDEIGAQGRPTARFDNLATRATHQLVELWIARDWEGWRACLAPDAIFSDRRRAMQVELGRDDLLELTRELGDMSSTRMEKEILATRGERLALSRVRLEVAEGDVGASEIEHLNTIETDAIGAIVGYVRFDVQDLEAATAYLDQRFADSDGGVAWAATQHLFASTYRRDVPARRALLAPDFRVVDHRPLGWGLTLDSPERFIQSQDSLVELAPDVRYRVDHFLCRGYAYLTQVAQVGTRDGGPFENPFLLTGTTDAEGHPLEMSVYDCAQLDDAFARFDEIAGGETASAPFDNAATRINDRMCRAWATGDWDALAACMAPAGRFLDRRAMLRVELDREQAIDSVRQLGSMESTRIHSEILATRGERLALNRLRVEVSGGDVGASEVVTLNVVETDEHGLNVTQVRFDPDDLEAAYREIEQRFLDGEGAGFGRYLLDFNRAVAERDWEALADSFAPDFVVHDRRLAGFGTLRNAGEFLAGQRAMVELAPDARVRTHHIRQVGRVRLAESAWVGTRDGGAFETPALTVVVLDPEGRNLHMDIFDENHLEEAKRCFEERVREVLGDGDEAAQA